MPRRLAAALLAGLVPAAAGAAAMTEQTPGRSTVLRTARDGDIAVREELDAARRAGTRAAYDRFLERHDGHRLAAVAQRERAALAGKPRI